MIINQTAEYALRAMAHLAQLPAGSSVRAKDLSGATGIPSDYVSKVLRRMVREGLLLSQKGHGGGFRLARPPAEITFADILAAVDEGLDPQHCAFGQHACNEGNPCLLHPAFSNLKKTVNQWAASFTLADLGPGKTPLPQVPPAANG